MNTVLDAKQMTRGGDLDANLPMPNRGFKSPDRGQLAYEADVAQRPNYHDGKPRKTWEQLSEIARSTWVAGN